MGSNPSRVGTSFGILLLFLLLFLFFLFFFFFFFFLFFFLFLLLFLLFLLFFPESCVSRSTGVRVSILPYYGPYLEGMEPILQIQT